MNTLTDEAQLDRKVRAFIYDELIERGSMPIVSHLADVMKLSVEEIGASFKRMKEAHVLVLQEGDAEILMANPFSAVPTPFLVTVGDTSWWGNCIWDALGIAAMVGQDATIITGCGDCNDAMQVQIEAGSARLADGTSIVHFSVPASKWWDNIKFT